MVTVTLAASLAPYLSDRGGGVERRSLHLDARTWTDLVREIRGRHTRLGLHLFEDSGRLRPGFVLVVNDEVVAVGDGTAEVSTGDSVYFFTQIAGG